MNEKIYIFSDEVDFISNWCKKNNVPVISTFENDIGSFIEIQPEKAVFLSLLNDLEDLIESYRIIKKRPHQY